MQMYVHTASPARPRLRSFPATAAAFRAAGTVFTGARGVLGVRTGGPGHSCESLKLILREKETNTRVVWWGNNILDSFHGRGQDRWAGYVGKPKTLLILSNPSCLCPVLFKVPKKCDLTTSFWTFCDLWCEDRLMGLACSSHAWKRVKTRGRGRITV